VRRLRAFVVRGFVRRLSSVSSVSSLDKVYKGWRLYIYIYIYNVYVCI
jgi:hypothetical protein